MIVPLLQGVYIISLTRPVTVLSQEVNISKKERNSVYFMLFKFVEITIGIIYFANIFCNTNIYLCKLFMAP